MPGLPDVDYRILAGLGGAAVLLVVASQFGFLSVLSTPSDAQIGYGDLTGDNQYRNGVLTHTATASEAAAFQIDPTAYHENDRVRIKITVGSSAVDNLDNPTICSAAFPDSQYSQKYDRCMLDYRDLAQYKDRVNVSYHLNGDGLPGDGKGTAQLIALGAESDTLSYVLSVATEDIPVAYATESDVLAEVDSGRFTLRFNIDQDGDQVYVDDQCPRQRAATTDGCPATSSKDTGTQPDNGTGDSPNTDTGTDTETTDSQTLDQRIAEVWTNVWTTLFGWI